MHRLIMNLAYGDGLVVDHINGDGLDNRRSNLRICSNLENSWNKISRPSVAGFRGVRKSRGKWLAEITQHGSKRLIGVFPSQIEAVLAYDKRAFHLRGEFAVLNLCSHFNQKTGTTYLGEGTA